MHVWNLWGSLRPTGLRVTVLEEDLMVKIAVNKLEVLLIRRVN